MARKKMMEGIEIQIDDHRRVPWYYWMAGHAATQALGVFLLTQCANAAFIEFSAHFAIDVGKCEKRFSLHVDQALHVATKAGIVALLPLIR